MAVALSNVGGGQQNFDHRNLSLRGAVGFSLVKCRMINALLYKTIDKEWNGEHRGPQGALSRVGHQKELHFRGAKDCKQWTLQLK